MTRFQADLTVALTEAFARVHEPRAINPLWLAHIDAEHLQRFSCEPEAQRLVERALVAPAAADLSVTTSTTERLLIAVDAVGAVLITDNPGGGHDWIDVSFTDLPRYLRALLPEGSALSAPPSMTSRTETTRLRLTASQRQQIKAALDQGQSAENAIRSASDVDPLLRDALLEDRGRARLELVLHAFTVDADPFLFRLQRRWTVGALGLYAADGERLLDDIHAVAPGDVLGTLLPLLTEGAALATSREAAA